MGTVIPANELRSSLGRPDIEQYRNISYQTRTHCLVCEAPASGPLIELPDFPLTEIYVDRRVDEKLGYLDQAFQFCSRCGHGQLQNVIDVNLQYGDNASYFFRTSQSASGREAAEVFLDFLKAVIGDKTFRRIVEVGCNDLYLLKALKSRAANLVGIDPILKGHEALFNEGNIMAIGDFFENVELGPDIDIVICKDVLEHISQPKNFLKKIVERASDKTLFFFQFPILDTLVADSRFDQVFHQHLNYFSLRSVLHMLEELGCGLLDYKINYDHWAAGLFAFQKGADNTRFRSSGEAITAEMIRTRYSLFKTEMKQTNSWLHCYRGQLLYGYGAALMLPVFSYFLENDLACLKYILDDDKNKDGLFYINLPTPIIQSSKVRDLRDSVVLLTAISSKISTKQLLKRLFEMNPKYIIYPLRTI